MSIFKLARSFQFKLALASEEDDVEVEADLEPINPDLPLSLEESGEGLSEEIAPVITSPAPSSGREISVSNIKTENLSNAEREKLSNDAKELIEMLDDYVINNGIFAYAISKDYFLSSEGDEPTQRHPLSTRFPRAEKARKLLLDIKREVTKIRLYLGPIEALKTPKSVSLESLVRPISNALDALYQLRSEDPGVECYGWSEAYDEYNNLAELMSVIDFIPGTYSEKSEVRRSRRTSLEGRNPLEASASKRAYTKLTEHLNATIWKLEHLANLFRALNSKGLVNNPQSKKDIKRLLGDLPLTRRPGKVIQKQEHHEIANSLMLFQSAIGIYTPAEFIDLCRLVRNGEGLLDLDPETKATYNFDARLADIPTEDLLRQAFTVWRGSKEEPPGVPFEMVIKKNLRGNVKKYISAPLTIAKLTELSKRLRYAKSLQGEHRIVQQTDSPETIRKYVEALPGDKRALFHKLPVSVRIPAYNGQISIEKIEQILQQAADIVASNGNLNSITI